MTLLQRHIYAYFLSGCGYLTGQNVYVRANLVSTATCAHTTHLCPVLLLVSASDCGENKVSTCGVELAIHQLALPAQLDKLGAVHFYMSLMGHIVSLEQAIIVVRHGANTKDILYTALKLVLGTTTCCQP